jgi:hypothetical protein
VKLSRHDKSADESAEAEVPVEEAVPAAGKGRPTPKRRDSQGQRGPVSAPRTRKEAMARQRQLAKEQKTTKAAAPKRSAAEQRAALKRGDADALPRRDQGPTRKLARDYVDSHRMFSQYILLALLVSLIASFAFAPLQILALVMLLGFIVECWFTGKRVRALAVERHGRAEGGNLSIGFYAGSRAYLPRRWRLPAPQVELGDEI